MAKLNPNMVLFNAAGVLIGVIVVGYNVMGNFADKSIPSCSLRYPRMIQFALESQSGEPLSPIELQARGGAGEAGVLDNVRVVAAKDGPTPLALEVKLDVTSSGEGPRGGSFNGIHMSWTPAAIEGPHAACLAYGMWIPQNFDFAKGGTLPGLYGGLRSTNAQPRAEDVEQGFYARAAWRTNGQTNVAAVFPGGTSGDGATLKGGFVLERGRWIRLEQEIILNQPGEPNGVHRLWVDGKLVGENNDVLWRRGADVTLAGLIADIEYMGNPATGPLIRLSAPVISWP